MQAQQAAPANFAYPAPEAPSEDTWQTDGDPWGGPAAAPVAATASAPQPDTRQFADDPWGPAAAPVAAPASAPEPQMFQIASDDDETLQ